MIPPKVSVVMPVYNASRFVAQAIESILCQTFAAFEFIIIDDGSTDGSLSVIQHYAQQDNRIVVISNPTNIGLIAALNSGIQIASTDFIARLDADDVALPMRLALQYQFLSTQKDYGLVAAMVTCIDTNSQPKHLNFLYRTFDMQHLAAHTDTAKAMLVWLCAFTHSSVMFRKSYLDGKLYQKAYYVIEDHEIWWRMAQGHRTIALPQVLVSYRMHQQSTSTVLKEAQKSSLIPFVKEQLAHIGIVATEREVLVHASINTGDYGASNYQIRLGEYLRWIVKMKLHNKNTLFTSVAAFDEVANFLSKRITALYISRKIRRFFKV